MRSKSTLFPIMMNKQFRLKIKKTCSFMKLHVFALYETWPAGLFHLLEVYVGYFAVFAAVV